MDFKHITVNWKTSTAGVIAIVSAIQGAVAQYQSAGLDGVKFGTLITALSFGIGLIFAKDYNVTGGTKSSTPATAAPVPPPPAPAGFARLLVLVAILAASLCYASTARADEPRFGGCIGQSDTCAGPRVSAALLAISLKDGSATSGVNIGLGYGITWHSTAWYQTGVAGYVNLRSTATGQAPVFSLAGTFANYVNMGLGVQVGGGSKFRDVAVIYLGLGADLGAAVAPAKVP